MAEIKTSAEGFPFASLPRELQVMIMRASPDLQTLQKLAAASPYTLAMYKDGAITTLKAVIANTTSPDIHDLVQSTLEAGFCGCNPKNSPCKPKPGHDCPSEVKLWNKTIHLKQKPQAVLDFVTRSYQAIDDLATQVYERQARRPCKPIICNHAAVLKATWQLSHYLASARRGYQNPKVGPVVMVHGDRTRRMYRLTPMEPTRPISFVAWQPHRLRAYEIGDVDEAGAFFSHLSIVELHVLIEVIDSIAASEKVMGNMGLHPVGEKGLLTAEVVVGQVHWQRYQQFVEENGEVPNWDEMAVEA
ncbi:hypothetical protein KC367_g8013 [Hortaea werneckii]|nr:hypothetical protein KC358_g6731 [Hortaea werneckii]KAI6836763.1 hypothetical protein KC350_g6221 [Hortaea werneckii]KAI6931902.1 hypothetical protein KC348_g7124 [Hortaea werneckii]KAI6935977.1 hypothetical protein KC341_g6552 [Hortaea werneckii]KAI6968789.1 hypothetical protein KC329_g14014 [Hortaea werneckii]